MLYIHLCFSTYADTPPAKKLKTEGSSPNTPESLSSTNLPPPCAAGNNPALLPPHVPSPSLANSTSTGGSAIAASNSSQIPKNFQTTSQGVSAQLPNSTQPVAQPSTSSNEQNLSNSEQVLLQQNNIDDNLDVSGTCTFVVNLGGIFVAWCCKDNFLATLENCLPATPD